MLLAIPASGRAQGRLEGTIRASAGPLTSLFSAQVRLSDGQRAFVDSLGHFRFDSVPPGRIIATARAVTYAPNSVTVTIRSRRTTRHDFLLHVDSFWIVKRQAQWLGCRGASSGIQCIAPRGLLAEPWGFRAGAWLFRDSMALSRFWLEHAPGNAASVRRLSPIDWSHENVVAVSYGSYSGCGPRKYVNRIELRGDTTVVVVGEDSLYDGPPRITCAAVDASTDFVIIPRARGAVVVRPANTGSGLRPLIAEIVASPAVVPMPAEASHMIRISSASANPAPAPLPTTAGCLPPTSAGWFLANVRAIASGDYPFTVGRDSVHMARTPRADVQLVQDSTLCAAAAAAYDRELVRLDHTAPRLRAVHVVKVGANGYVIVDPTVKAGEWTPAIFVDPSMTRFLGNWTD